MIYTEIGWSGSTIGLAITRVQQERAIPRDIPMLRAVVEALDGFAGGAYEQDDKPPLFSRIEGLLVFVRTVHEWGRSLPGSSIRQRAGALAVMLKDFLDTGQQGELLGNFFRKVHDVAEEIEATGLSVNPVVEVFARLA